MKVKWLGDIDGQLKSVFWPAAPDLQSFRSFLRYKSQIIIQLHEWQELKISDNLVRNFAAICELWIVILQMILKYGLTIARLARPAGIEHSHWRLHLFSHPWPNKTSLSFSHLHNFLHFLRLWGTKVVNFRNVLRPRQI